MYDGLRHQHPIEWIRVEPRQPACVKSRLLSYIERHNAARVADRRDKNISPLRERKASQSMFNADFPSRSGTEVTLVVAIQERRRSRLA